MEIFRPRGRYLRKEEEKRVSHTFVLSVVPIDPLRKTMNLVENCCSKGSAMRRPKTSEIACESSLPYVGSPSRQPPVTHRAHPSISLESRELRRTSAFGSVRAKGMNEYRKQAQITELNALNAVMAVIRFKQHFKLFDRIDDASCYIFDTAATEVD